MVDQYIWRGPWDSVSFVAHEVRSPVAEPGSSRSTFTLPAIGAWSMKPSLARSNHAWGVRERPVPPPRGRGAYEGQKPRRAFRLTCSAPSDRTRSDLSVAKIMGFQASWKACTQLQALACCLLTASQSLSWFPTRYNQCRPKRDCSERSSPSAVSASRTLIYDVVSSYLTVSIDI